MYASLFWLHIDETITFPVILANAAPTPPQTVL